MAMGTLILDPRSLGEQALGEYESQPAVPPARRGLSTLFLKKIYYVPEEDIGDHPHLRQ
jgi:hypothetical protein